MTYEECRKNNVCPMCYGKIYFETRSTKLKNLSGIKCCCEDGTYLGHLLEEHIPSLEENIKRLKKDYKELQDWVKLTSQCNTCGGDQWKIYGGMNCECGLPGKQYWPG